MNITYRTVVLLSALFISFSAMAQEKTVDLNISGMTCGICPITVRHSLLGMKGVHAASVDLKSKTATITYEDSQQSPQNIANHVTNLGYPSVIIGGRHE